MKGMLTAGIFWILGCAAQAASINVTQYLWRDPGMQAEVAYSWILSADGLSFEAFAAGAAGPAVTEPALDASSSAHISVTFSLQTPGPPRPGWISMRGDSGGEGSAGPVFSGAEFSVGPYHGDTRMSIEGDFPLGTPFLAIVSGWGAGYYTRTLGVSSWIQFSLFEPGCEGRVPVPILWADEQPIPEPATVLLILAGITLMLCARYAGSSGSRSSP